MTILRDTLGTQLVRGSGVPGGHRIIVDGVRKPHVPTMRECNSIELLYDDIVADIGAYCGTFALRCARFPVVEVRAFEPSPISYAVLAANQNRNLRLYNAAVVSDGRESVEFYLSRGIGVTNSLLPSRAKDAITVPAISYDEAVHDATVVKVDIEGGEYQLGPLVRDSIRALVVDFHPVGRDWIANAEAIIAEIEAASFVSIIRPNWANGWMRAGSWVRERPRRGRASSLYHGDACTGCGTATEHGGRLVLCPTCFDLWSLKERAGFTRAEVVV